MFERATRSFECLAFVPTQKCVGVTEFIDYRWDFLQVFKFHLNFSPLQAFGIISCCQSD